MPEKVFKQYITAAILILIGLYFIKVLNLSYPLTIATTTKSSELAVVGEAKIDVVPDTAYVDVGITVSNAPTVEAAQSQINDVNTKMLEALKKIGIKKEDIKTANYIISPNYSYEANTNRIVGYNGEVTLTIKLKNTSLASQVIEQATKAGANQVGGVRFTIDNPEKFREQARDLAIKNAKEQAQKLAKNLGISLGKIVNVVESPQAQPVPLIEGGARAVGGGASQIEPGSQTITSIVTLYFEKR